MKKRMMTKLMLAAAAGTMLMAMPMTAMADRAYRTEASDAAVPAVTGLGWKLQDGEVHINWQNKLKNDDGVEQSVYIEYSTDASFPDNNLTNYEWSSGTSLQLDDAFPGKTYYVRAFIREYNENTDDTKYGAYSDPIAVTTLVPEVSISDTVVTSDSVTFRFGYYQGFQTNHVDLVYDYSRNYDWDYNGDGTVDANDKYEYTDEYVDQGYFPDSLYENVTGFEICRAQGNGSYKLIATVADTAYTDKNLKSMQNYRYKIRAYVLDPVTNKKIYGKYSYKKVTTWGSDLNLKAVANGTKKIKLTWKKVAGATGYKIYRVAGEGNDTTWKSGTDTSYSNYELIKTIKKGSAASYTDTKVESGEAYSYRVEAYKTVKSGKTTKELKISQTAYCSLGYDGYISVKSEDVDLKGNVKVVWDKIKGVDGYIVERYDDKTEDWIQVTKLKNDAASYTFAALAEDAYAEYRMCAYTGNVYSSYHYVYPEYRSYAEKTAAITAKADASGVVTVSWAPVKGASYYKVYRSRQIGRYNADMGYYNIPSGTTLRVLKKPGVLSADASYYKETPVYTDKIPATVTSVKDQYYGYSYVADYKWDEKTQQDIPVIKAIDIQKAPAAGVRYYYYVQAYAQDGTPVVNDLKDDIWDEEKQDYVEKVVGQTKSTYYRGGLSGKPASIVIGETTLKAPAISKITSAKKGKAVVSWKKVTGASKYYVYYSAKKNSGYTFAGITTANKLTVSGLTSGKKYYFKVKSCTFNAAGADVYSALSSAKTKKVK